MQEEVIVAGFGGQGVLFAGTLIAQAAIEEKKHTTWFPSYGAEMRGGTANSTVVISDEEIGSPIVASPSVLVALNEQSLKYFAPQMQAGTLVIINSSLIEHKFEAKDINAAYIAASEIADKELKDVRVANLVALGAYLKFSKMIRLESALKAVEVILTDKPKFIDINKKALELGYNLVRNSFK